MCLVRWQAVAPLLCGTCAGEIIAIFTKYWECVRDIRDHINSRLGLATKAHVMYKCRTSTEQIISPWTPEEFVP